MNKLIIGLGNPGVKYKLNRHNLGFLIVDEICKSMKLKWKESPKFDVKYINAGELGFIKPLTFMNNSGTPVQKFIQYHGISLENVYVIHDDLDLPFLTVKKQLDASSAGHNGVEDIIEKLDSKAFWRVRVGTGRPLSKNEDVSQWVLSNFNKKEIDGLFGLVEEIKALIF